MSGAHVWRAVHARLLCAVLCAVVAVPLNAATGLAGNPHGAGVFAQGDRLSVMTQKGLYAQPRFDDDALSHVAVFHEGGLAITVRRQGARGTQDGRDGTWVYAALTAGQWDASGAWVPKGSLFWVFVCDDDTLVFF